MKTEITPGKWEQNADTVWRGGHEIVCHPINSPQSIADARAIAAMPAIIQTGLELLASIERAKAERPRQIDPGSRLDKCTDAFRNALNPTGGDK